MSSSAESWSSVVSSLLLGEGTRPSGWRRYAQALAEHFTVYLPSHPGFDGSERPVWLQSVFDLVCFYTWFLETPELEGIRVMGWGLGGWLAAEMAATTRHAFSKMLLVDAAGIKPQVGEITDLFILSPTQIRNLTFYDVQQVPEYAQLYGHDPSPAEREQALQNREMAVRLTWKPYMHDPRLAHLLARVTAPTRIVWGRQNKIIPVECGSLYQQAIPGANLEVIERCGRRPIWKSPTSLCASRWTSSPKLYVSTNTGLTQGYTVLVRPLPQRVKGGILPGLRRTGCGCCKLF